MLTSRARITGCLLTSLPDIVELLLRCINTSPSPRIAVCVAVYFGAASRSKPCHTVQGSKLRHYTSRNRSIYLQRKNSKLRRHQANELVADFDIIFAGGGLANGLTALRIAQQRPGLRLLIADAGKSLGGNHTWSFHGTDVSDADRRFLKPMMKSEWTGQKVVFPEHARFLSTSYHSIDSSGFHAHLQHSLPDGTIHLGNRINSVAHDHIALDGGQRFSAPCVIDGRGWRGGQRADDLALTHQKFVGLEIEMKVPHGLTHPIIMDATVSQTDGYRFVYCLPYTETNVLIEDTYYADEADLDLTVVSDRITRYAKNRGWEPKSVTREENGVLPIVLAGSVDAFFAFEKTVPKVGLRAGLFHPTTGYSLPDAVRLAGAIAAAPVLTSQSIAALVDSMARKTWADRGFYRLLNRMLFTAADDEQRRSVMQRFYRLPQELIERFYAGQISFLDKARILTGRPPVPLWRAIKALPPSAGVAFVRNIEQTGNE
ncbi:MAG: lycopene beta-cyclase CrtY [Hyphomicrobiaceae bacterium]